MSHADWPHPRCFRGRYLCCPVFPDPSPAVQRKGVLSSVCLLIFLCMQLHECFWHYSWHVDGCLMTQRMWLFQWWVEDKRQTEEIKSVAEFEYQRLWKQWLFHLWLIYVQYSLLNSHTHIDPCACVCCETHIVAIVCFCNFSNIIFIANCTVFFSAPSEKALCTHSPHRLMTYQFHKLPLLNLASD